MVFIVRVGKIIFLELLGSLFRKKKGIRIADQDFIILNQPGQQGGMNGKLLRSPSSCCLPKPINGFVLPRGAETPGIAISEKGSMLWRKTDNEMPGAAWGKLLLGWFLVISWGGCVLF